ncbi:MAG: DUF362 domain-containing protein [Candidatus Thorarchaeota archaeon]|nr:DUF362 domain-containing protein [Candidatus Thorarchaeota archaeon]
MMAVVSIVQSESIRTTVEESIRLLGGIDRFVQPESKVVIKPNLVFGLPPYTGFTTDYPIVQAIIELCQDMGKLNISIAEGSGGIDTNLAFRVSGYVELAEKYNLKLVDLNGSPNVSVPVPSGQAIQELRVPKIILDCDVLINMPKLKLYRIVQGKNQWASLAVKNLMGAIPGKGDYSDNRPSGFCLELSQEFLTTKGKYYHSAYRRWWSPSGEKRRIHKDLVHGLADINTVIRPTLNIIDGIVVSNDIDMTNTRGQDPFNLNTILASQDPLAIDFIAARIGGLSPFKIPYLEHAAERGIGESDYNKIQTLGISLDEIIETWEKELSKRQRSNSS